MCIRGMCKGTVETMRDDGKDEATMIARLMSKYDLTQEEAEKYLLPTAV